MKRICAALLAVLLAFSCLAVTAFANGAEGDRMYGDVNGDGKINLRDVILVIRVSLEYDEKIDREMADVNLDEKLSEAGTCVSECISTTAAPYTTRSSIRL